MGNRAIIALNSQPTGAAIYLHWNGGPESVLAFLEAAKQLGVRSPESDPDYFRARLAQIIGNFFGGTTSIGIGSANRLDDSDNGKYFVGGDFKIERRQCRYKTLVDASVTDVGGLTTEARERYESILTACLELNGKLFAPR
jgi:hypothetical protein